MTEKDRENYPNLYALLHGMAGARETKDWVKIIPELERLFEEKEILSIRFNEYVENQE